MGCRSPSSATSRWEMHDKAVLVWGPFRDLMLSERHPLRPGAGSAGAERSEVDEAHLVYETWTAEAIYSM
jgi:hypothetical protein